MQELLPEEMLNASEASKLIKMHEQTFRRLARNGKIPAFKVGGRWKFKKSDLLNLNHQKNVENKLIYLIDDEKGIRRLLEKILTKNGYEVRSFDSGPESLRHFAKDQPDLVITDLKMPDMDGAELIGHLRYNDEDIPIIILTAYPDGEILERALEYTPFVMLSKPCEDRVFVKTVQDLLNV